MSNDSATVTAVINIVPIGSILPYMGTLQSIAGLKAQGWLLCDGTLCNTSDYPNLYNAIGNAFGGSSNSFNLPDLRGVFIRGVSMNSGQDPDANSRVAQNPNGNTGNAVGTRQSDMFASHSHTYNHWATDGFRLTNHENDWEPPHKFVINDSTGAAGGNETRPKNVYAYYIIFAGIPGTTR